jgi:uroporphyrinogen decarboxylase
MTGKELVLKAMNMEETERIPWVPFCGVHSASLIGKTASEFLQSSEYIIEGLNKAIDLYKADGFPIILIYKLKLKFLVVI